MKHIFSLRYTALFAACCVLFLTQCKEDDYTGASSLTATSPTVTVDWGEIPSSLTETDVTYPFTVSLSEPQIVDVEVALSLGEGSTATEGSDISFPHTIKIKAHETSASGELSIIGDETPEGTETANVVVSVAKASSGNAKVGDASRSITIENYADQDAPFVMTFAWGGEIEITVGGNTYTGIEKCSYVDMDFLLFGVVDGALADLGDYQAASAACPEEFKIDSKTWAHGDGTFIIAANLYENAALFPDEGVLSFPLTTTFAQTGLISESAYNPAIFDSTTANGDIKVLYLLNVADGKFSVLDPDTEEVIVTYQ